VVPVVVGGLIGGSLGGIATAVILVPWFNHLITRSRPAQPIARVRVGAGGPPRPLAPAAPPRIQRRDDAPQPR
jgi:hypothetical protein